MTNIFNVYQIIYIWKKLERDIIPLTDQLHTCKAVIRWYGNKCAHLSSHQILIFPNILIPPFSFHIRTHLFHHAWLMTAILVHFYASMAFISRQKATKTCMWYTISHFVRNPDIELIWSSCRRRLLATTAILSSKFWTICISQVSWTRFVERNFVKCPKTSGLMRGTPHIHGHKEFYRFKLFSS